MKFWIVSLSFAFALMTAPAAFAGDAASGEGIYNKKCKACHTVDAGGKHRVGPNLHGIAGKPAGQQEGFKKYSKALLGSGVTWDNASLDQYLEAPKKFIKGTRMAFPGLKKPSDRADVIAFLETLK